MSRLRERKADRFRQRMRRMLPDIIRMMDVYERDPQMGALMIRERQLDMRVRHAAMKFHRSEDPEEKKPLREQIRKLVGEVFDVQVRRRALEIESLKSRLAELTEQLSAQEEMRDELIKQRAQNVLSNRPPRLRERGPRDGPESDRLRPEAPDNERPDDD